MRKFLFVLTFLMSTSAFCFYGTGGVPHSKKSDFTINFPDTSEGDPSVKTMELVSIEFPAYSNEFHTPANYSINPGDVGLFCQTGTVGHECTINVVYNHGQPNETWVGSVTINPRTFELISYKGNKAWDRPYWTLESTPDFIYVNNQKPH